MAIVIFLSFYFAKLWNGFLFPKKNQEENVKGCQDKNTGIINLRGRVKRSPNNINYNELFIEQNASKPKSKKKKELHNKDTNEKEINIQNCNNGNLDDFFQKVKEKDDFEKLFSDNIYVNVKGNVSLPPKKSLENVEVLPSISNNNNKNEDLIVFDNLDTILLKPTPLEKEARTNQNNQSPMSNLNPVRPTLEDINNKSLSMENKIKNANLFYQTPLASIRKNTNSSKN